VEKLLSILHTFLHVGSCLLATAIFGVSFLAFVRDHRLKVLLLAAGFLLLDIHEIMEFLGVLGIMNPMLPLPGTLGIEPIHYVSFVTVLLFLAGVLKR
jgi:hypothetical protein